MSEDKGEWAETAEEGIVDAEHGSPGADDSAVTGRRAESDAPATTDGVDPEGGAQADAVTDGGSEPAPDGEPDLKDAAAGPRQSDLDAAD